MEQKSVTDETDEISQGKDVKLRIKSSCGKELDPVSQVMRRKKVQRKSSVPKL